MAAIARIDVRGLRDLRGRFASLADRKLAEIQMEEARNTAQTVQQIYRRRAPRSRGHSASGLHFFEGLNAYAVEVGGGFQITVTTDRPDLRRWLAEGTGLYGPLGRRIYPTHVSARMYAHGPHAGQPRPAALQFFNWISPAGGTGPFYFRSIRGMHPNPWEVDAAVEAVPFAQKMGGLIGERAARYVAEGI
jgi:hypothetical protein